MHSDRSNGSSKKKKKNSQRERQKKEPTVKQILDENGIGDDVIDHIII